MPLKAASRLASGDDRALAILTTRSMSSNTGPKMAKTISSLV
ncbi:Uncharacterised protein [Mycobacteroides abscessus subsp. abscessus]|nr:Uncharacterised protein [Mycobacteroides abscessus subsp. abscessus]